MNATECMKGRRSIRKYKKGCIDHSLLESIISTASYSPSWKNTQITRYIAIEDTSILNKIADEFTPDYNSNIIRQVSTLIAVTLSKGAAVMSEMVLFQPKRKTVGRCSMSVLPARHFVLLHMKPVLAL